MTLAVIFSRASIGVNAPLITVETHIANGLPAFTIVGLPEASVKEAKDRVRSALLNSRFKFPDKRITVNLAPADLPKEGGRYDLPIALGILAASGQISADRLNDYEFAGELALSGALRKIYGTISAIMAAKSASRQLIIPSENTDEAALIEGTHSYPADHLLAVTAHINGQSALPPAPPVTDFPAQPTSLDMQDVIGQPLAKRALEICAAGRHNLLFLGPPGTGKTMLASRLPGLQPNMSEAEALESAAIHSVGGHPPDPKRWRHRPFRSPHHTASAAALVGGGSTPKPGEISLAHNGVLFLDELPEFDRRVLDSLREPLESGEIMISRARQQVCYPACFQLIAAMNPSPSGYLHEQDPRTHRNQVQRYLAKLSGPLLDRFDLSIEVPLLPKGSLSQTPARGETSQQIRARVVAAQTKQQKRAGKLNNQLNSKEIEQHCQLPLDDARYLEHAIETLGLSIRAYHRILRVSRTIADLADSPVISRRHLTEALSYRAMDRLLKQLHA